MKADRPSVTIGFTSHRIETLTFAGRLMEKHDVIIIEEAPNPRFLSMLDKEIPIRKYIQEEYLEFPLFSEKYYRILRRLRKKGKQIIQIEPYIEKLLSIYEMFSDCKKPSDVLSNQEISEVYKIERKATAALLSFYESSLGNSFSDTIISVKRFALADAVRFRLRDTMRAEAISTIISEDKKTYVEAGGIHIYLEKMLKQKIGERVNIEVNVLLEPFVQRLTGEREFLPPGDLLTIHYILQKSSDEEFENLQAARSLIYIKLLKKEEMLPTRGKKAPHITDEIIINNLVSKFTMDQCEELYKKIRFQNRNECLETVKSYLE